MDIHRRRAAACAAFLGTFLATLDISIVNVALPTIQGALQTDIAGLQWVVNAYAVCLSAFMLSAGPVADRYGHKRAWLAGAGLFTAASALCGLAPTLPVLLAGRALQGVSAAFLIAGAMPILTHLFPEPRARAHVIGGWSAFTALALILGPLAGGLLLSRFGWQSIFLINLPLGAAAIALGAWGMSERRYPDHAALDPVGQVLGIVSLGALAYGMIDAGERGFIAAAPLIGLAAAGFVLFAVVEMRATRPLVPVALFRRRSFVIVNGASFMLGFAYYSSLFFASIYLQQIQGWSPSEAGWRMMPQFVATGLISMLFGRFSARVPIWQLMIAGYGLIAVAMSGMVVLGAATPYGLTALLFSLLGAGAGLAVPATGIVVMGMAPPELAGSVSATMNALRQAGMTIGISLLGALMSSRATSVLTHALDAQGAPDAQAIARQAVRQHVLADSAPGLASLHVAALESGFHLAMLCAGLGCAAAMLGLIGLEVARRKKGSSL